ncbi:hypothetical protein D3C75_1235300 [compost metagenome]
MTAADWRSLTEQVRSLIVPAMPFAARPQRGKDAVWIKPSLVYKVHFLEWNSSGTLRQPVIQAQVDLPPEACRLDQRG